VCFDHSVRKTIQLSSPQGRLLPAGLTTHLAPFFLCIRIDSTAADHCARLSIIAAARIGIREQDLCNCRASVCLSVRHIIGPLHVAAAGLLLWARRQEIYRSTAKRPALSSKCERVALSADVGPNYITSVFVDLSNCFNKSTTNSATMYRPGGGETICPPGRWQFDGRISFRRQSGHLSQSTDPKIALDLRPSSDESAVRTSLLWPPVAKLQAANVPIA